MAVDTSTIKQEGGGFRRRLVWSHVAVAAIGLVMLLIVFYMLVVVRSVALRSAELRGPTARNSTLALQGVQRSLAGLRGWVAIGEESFRNHRKKAWDQDIDSAITTLEALSPNWTNPANQKRLDDVKRELAQLREIQWWIEDVAQTPGNEPARVILERDVAPTYDSILAATTAMFEIEREMGGGDERTPLLSGLAELRNYSMQAAITLRAIVDADHVVGDFQVDVSTFEHDLNLAKQHLADLNAHRAMLVAGQLELLPIVETELPAFEALARDVITARLAPDWNVARQMLADEAAPTAAIVTELLEAMSKDQERLMLEEANNVDNVSSAAMVIGLLSILFMVFATLFFSRQNVAQLLNPIAAVTRVTEELAGSSSQIATSAQQQVSSLTEAATSLNEISTTAEEFKGTIQEFADRSRAVREAAQETADKALQGQAAAQESAARTEAVRESTRAAGETILQFAEQMERITEITHTVNEIAEQTKLLALNASIEAARAGEGGRGFAIVATQVRELADQSKQAAGNISGLIGETQKMLRSVVQRIEQGSQQSQDTADTVRAMANQFESIVTAFTQTADAMTQISSGAKVQEDGIIELVNGLSQVETASRQTATSAEQTQAAIDNIDQQIVTLSDTMRQL